MKLLQPYPPFSVRTDSAAFRVMAPLAPDRITSVRSRILEMLSAPHGQLYPTEIVDSGLAHELLVETGVISALHARFQRTIFVLPDLNVHVNQFGNNNRFDGWHRDCGNEMARSRRYVFEQQYRVWKVGIYLQANDGVHGGGINIVPNSEQHVLRKGRGASAAVPLRALESQLRARASVAFGRGRLVPLEAGDIFAFDSRVLHQSTPARQVNSIAGEDKIVFYFSFADSARSAQWYAWNVFLRACEDGTRLHREALALDEATFQRGDLISSEVCQFVVAHSGL